MKDFGNISLNIQNTVDSIAWFLPEITLSIGFLLVIILDLFIKRSKTIVFFASLLTLLISGTFLVAQYIGLSEKLVLFNGMFLVNTNLVIFKLITLFACLLSIIYFTQDKKLKTHLKGTGDFYSIFIASVLAMFTLISSANLLMFYVSVEMISLASYLMVTYTAVKKNEAEAGLKYVLFGVASSALMLYGISFIYGFSGTLDLFNYSIPAGLSEVSSISGNIAVILFMTGIGFKLSFVPFQFWTPDVYQASPTSITSFLSTAPKIAVFAFLFSVNDLFHLSGEIYYQILLGTSIISMIVGNVMAVFQDDPKRLMAYSSIGHTGFLLMLFVIPELDIFSALTFYLVTYTLMNVGSFLSFSYFENKFGALTLNDFKGLGKSSVLVGTCLVVFMVSLIGLPPTAGFIAKFLVFTSIIQFQNLSLPIILLLSTAVITTVISLFYYFKFPLNLFLRIKDDNNTVEASSSQLKSVIFIILLTILVLIIGIFPSLVKI